VNPPRLSASTITDDQLDQLYRRIETLEAVAAGNKRHVQLIVPDLQRALAALDRVRAVADRIEAGAPWTASHQDTAARIRAALDPTCTCTYGERCPNCRD